ncbi:chondroitin sulfate synthase 1 [Anabrus simplex]|uniref:chondroitin sulfate synthase 1 n=1 Tax=Anabrus simplex TaxID=316456 RepID=UPI0034DD3DE7
MVANFSSNNDHHEAYLCHPATELVTFTPSRPMVRRPPIMMIGRKRRGMHTVFGILVGLLVGFLVTSRAGVGFISALWGNKTCPASDSKSWPVPPGQPQYDRIYQEEQDPLAVVGLTDSSETIHNSKRRLVFVGVMTAEKYLSTRAVAVFETWGREIPGRIAFFSSEVSTVPANRTDLPLVPLKGVDDSYPPQKKSFLMLRYMWENYGDKFEWFLRADDDVYVRPDKLEKLLRSVDSRKPQFIGQAGRGNQEEFGLLSLEYDENFCMGGPGVIMSRETLSRVAPHIKYCLKNLYTTHEDVELGRCVQKFAGIPCTWSYEMQTILYHNSSGNDAFTGSLKQKEVHRAITLHPVKHYEHMYRVHNYMKSLKIQDLQQKVIYLHREIMSMMKELGHKPEEINNFMVGKNFPLFSAKKGSHDYLGDTAMLGIEPGLNKFLPSTEEEVLKWDFISRSLFSDTNSNPRRRLETPLKEGLDDVVREVMDMINMYSKQRGRVIEYRDILYGYHRLNPLYGADYILDMLLVYKKYRGRKMTVPVRRHVYLQQQFGDLEIREVLDGEEVSMPLAETEGEMAMEDFPDAQNGFQNSFKDVFENGLLKIGESFPLILGSRMSKKTPSIKDKLINFILPLAGRLETFKRFISVFEEVCLKNDEKVSLIIVLFPNDKENSINETVSIMRRLQKEYPKVRLTVVPVFDTFARAMALEVGASQCADEDLLFFVDVDMVFTSSALHRIRTNTIRGKQVYFPIVYSEFDPSIVYNESGLLSSPNHFLINRDTGYWRQYGFGIASLYKSDLKRVGGFDTSIRGWGKEDVDLFDKFVAAAKNLTVFRAADPNLVHVFHIVECDPNLDEAQLRMCKGTRADTYGGVYQLAQYIYSHKEVLEFAKKRMKQEPPS